MFFPVVVAYAFHIDIPFIAFGWSVVSNATNLSRALLHCDFCNVFLHYEVGVFSFKATNVSFFTA